MGGLWREREGRREVRGGGSAMMKVLGHLSRALSWWRTGWWHFRMAPAFKGSDQLSRWAANEFRRTRVRHLPGGCCTFLGKHTSK